MNTYDKIKKLCDEKGCSISNLPKIIPELNVAKSSINGWKNGAEPRADKLKAIADYFGVTVEYLKSEDDNVTVHTVNDNHGVIGNANAPVTFNAETEHKLTEQETELFNIFKSLSVVDKAKVIIYASELAQK